MTEETHEYGLDWIDQDGLFDVTYKTFKRILGLDDYRAQATPPDPFTLVAHAVATRSELGEAIGFETERSINKTLSNNFGLWHQRVLALADGWEDLGTTGGGVDIKMTDARINERFGKSIYAEVKNRYNTIKASDEKELWDKLSFLTQTNNCIAYVFQIVPKVPEQYDEPWKVSGRESRENVRCCDGISAYDMVFDRRNALVDIYSILPELFEDVTGGAVDFSNDEIMDLFYRSFPR